MTFVQVLATTNRPGMRVRMQGLDPEADYEVTCDYDGALATSNGQSSIDEATGTLRKLGRFNGDTLMKHGIIVPRVRGDYQALMYEVKKA